MTNYPLTTLRIYSRHYDTPEKRARLLRVLDEFDTVDEVWLSTAAGTQSMRVHKETLEHCKAFAEDLRKRNIAVSIQLSSTLGHFGGAAFTAKDAFQWTEDDLLVGHDGKTNPGVCCPSSPKFVQWCADVFAMYCKELQPLAGYIDDDLRFHNHGPIEQSCCCRRCLDLFGKMTGRTWTRAQVQKVLDSPKDQPLRRKWVELHTRLVAEFCRAVGEKVHAVSPGTHLGLQNQHAKVFYTCWNFSPVFKAIKEATGLPARVRIGGGSWTDYDPRFIARKSFISACDIDDVRAENYADLWGNEEESYPCTVMNKTAYAKAVESALYLATGGNNITFQGGSLWDDPDSTMEEMLRTIKTWYPLFARLKELADKYRFDGVTALVHDGIISCPAGADHPWYAFWSEEAEGLRLATIPLRLSKRASQEGKTPGYLTEETARGMTKETFDRFLRAGVIMTGDAYLELQKQGLTKDFGVKGAKAPWSSNARFAAGPGKGTPLHLNLNGSKAVSFTFGPDCKAEELMTLFRGKREAVGAWRLETPQGRIAVIGTPGRFSRDLSAYMLDLYRDLFDWAGEKPVSVRLEGPTSAVLIPLADESGRLRAVSILNTGIAPRTGLKLRVRRPHSCKGSWLQAGKPAVTIRGEKAKDGTAVFTLPELGAWQFSLLELE